MKKLIILKLNEDGKKALGTDTKVLEVEEADVERITCGTTLNELFPLSLVESWEVTNSFLNLDVNSCVLVINRVGKRDIARVVGRNKKSITVQLVADRNKWYYFNSLGIEVSNAKVKAHLEFISSREAATLINNIKREPFGNVLDLLSDGGKTGLNYDISKINVPKWLDKEAINDVLRILQRYQSCYKTTKRK